MEKSGKLPQYVDLDGIQPWISLQSNSSVLAIEGITSKDGRIFGKMAHDERFTPNTFMNVPGKKDQRIFEAGVAYFL